LKVHADRKARSIVAHDENALPLAERPKLDLDMPGSVVRKRMLESIRYKFVDDQAARHGLSHVQVEIADFDGQLPAMATRVIGSPQMLTETLHMACHLDPGEISGLIQILMHQRHRPHPIAAVRQLLRDGGICDA